MRHDFLSTVTAISAIFAAVAVVPARAQDTQAQDTRAQDKIDITTWNYAELYSGWSAEEFLDAEVYDEDGEEIGEVEDLVVTPEGDVQQLVIEAGGFLDIGDAHFAYPWEDARIANLDRVEVEFDEDNIEDYSLFGDLEGEPVGPRNWRITELIDDYAALGEDVRYGWVDDVIISPQGEVQAVVVQPDVAYGPGGPYAWPYYGYPYGWEPGMNYYTAPYTEEEIAELQPFDYERLNEEGFAEVGEDRAADTAEQSAPDENVEENGAE